MLSDYYSIEKTLRRQGFDVGRMDDSSRVIQSTDPFYELLKFKSKRRILAAIYHEGMMTVDEILTKYSNFTRCFVVSTVQKCVAEGAVRVSDDPIKPIADRDLGVTFEWFTAEIVKREMSGIASFAVHINGLRTGGDYDVIARLDDVVVYIECKAGSLGGVSRGHIAEFIKRDGELSPNLSLFIVDAPDIDDDFVSRVPQIS